MVLNSAFVRKPRARFFRVERNPYPGRGTVVGMLGTIVTSLLFTFLALAQEPPRDDSTVARPAHVLDARRLRAVTMDMLGRPPFEAERERWLGRGLYELCDALLEDGEIWSHWYEEQLYYFLLIDNFRPASARVASIPMDLHQGRADVRDAIWRISLSPAFDARNPGADTFVTVVMEQLDGMAVQKNARELEIGKAIYDGTPGLFLKSRGENQSDVVRIAIENERFATTFLAREYARIVRAAPGRGALARWAQAFRKDPFVYADLLREWLASPAYAARLEQRRVQPNRLFVRSLFVDLLGRLPSIEEEARMRNALDGLSDSGPLRSVLARLLIDSGAAVIPAREEIVDPTSWVAGLFERLLGRSAEDGEQAVFVKSFHDPDCKPGTVVYAIVSHPEYHSY